VFRSVKELEAAIREYIDVHNEDPKPFVWTRTADQILDSIARYATRTLVAHGLLVLSGSQDVAIQVLCNFLNHLLGNYGSTVDIEQPSCQRQGSDAEIESLLDELDQGRVAALLIWGVNPVYELPLGKELGATLQKVPLVISFDECRSETAELARFVCPDHHYLESWGDREPVPGIVSILQPCVHPLGNTRALIETLAAWSDDPKPAYELVQGHWRTHLFARQKAQPSFQLFWDHAVHEGIVRLEAPSATASSFLLPEVHPLSVTETPGGGEFSLVLYPKPGILDGRHAYNPWLQELPDPITKVTWDNYACLSPSAASELGVRDGDYVEIQPASDETLKLELPVLVQPGQHDRVVAVALGYGTKASQRFAKLGPEWIGRKPTLNDDGRVGRNAAPLLRMANGHLAYSGLAVSLRATGHHEALACTQTHHSITVPESLALPGGERRPVIQETTFDEYLNIQRSGNRHEQEAHGLEEDLWPPDHPITGHRWAMAIDLDACTGCSGCGHCCQVENNVPVVGKDEVRRHRDEVHVPRFLRRPEPGRARRASGSCECAVPVIPVKMVFAARNKARVNCVRVRMAVRIVVSPSRVPEPGDGLYPAAFCDFDEFSGRVAIEPRGPIAAAGDQIHAAIAVKIGPCRPARVISSPKLGSDLAPGISRSEPAAQGLHEHLF
jgi:molybdopterin-containing oxidoreductase family iron-sulfur binding subunit